MTTNSNITQMKPRSLPAVLLRLEGLAVLAVAIVFYAQQHYSGWVFIGLLLAPDLSMLAMLLDSRMGSVVYNIVHHYGLPLALAIVALTTGWGLGLQLALIWLAHIGRDRLAGYGFKYVGQFKETHLGRV